MLEIDYGGQKREKDIKFAIIPSAFVLETPTH